MVHPAGVVLAVGAGGPGAVTLDLAAPAAVPNCRNRGGRRARIGVGRRDPARPPAARSVDHWRNEPNKAITGPKATCRSQSGQTSSNAGYGELASATGSRSEERR